MKPTKAILVVSFGTSYEDTRKKTIEAIEEQIRTAYPDYRIYRAWTSKMIIRKLKNRDDLIIDTVTEAMERMKREGIRDVIVQPTHVINGIENDLMIEDTNSFAEDFASIHFGTPLLTSEEDHEAVIQVLTEEYKQVNKETALVFMGHGTTHYANTVYAALDYMFKDFGYKHVYLGTVEAYPTMASILRQIKDAGYKKAVLVPFMIVAGDHARNDMSSEDPDSWRCQFEKNGLDVECVMRGLGEYKGIQDIFLKHIKDVL